MLILLLLFIYAHFVSLLLSLQYSTMWSLPTPVQSLESMLESKMMTSSRQARAGTCESTRTWDDYSREHRALPATTQATPPSYAVSWAVAAAAAGLLLLLRANYSQLLYKPGTQLGSMRDCISLLARISIGAVQWCQKNWLRPMGATQQQPERVSAVVSRC